MSVNTSGKKSSRIEKYLSKTEGVRSTDQISQEDAPAPTRIKTAVGMTAALNAAQERIKELETSGREIFLPVAAIGPNPWQPRLKFDPVQLQQLANSIDENGLLQPVLVRRKANYSPIEQIEYDLVAGERRLKAHQLLGLTEIKAVIAEVTDADMVVMALVENLDRQDLADYEIGKAIRRAEQEFPSRKELAKSLGMSRSDLYKYLAFESLPEVVQADLDVSPTLLGRVAAENLIRAIKAKGSVAEAALLAAWQRFKAGGLDQQRLVSMVDSADTPSASGPDRDIRKLFVAGDTRQVGSITRDHKSFTVRLKVSALSPEQEASLRVFVANLLNPGEPQT